jgi:hypothetical protein
VAAWTAYDIVGKKEDVSDIISNISPTKTPFTSMTGQDKIHNTLFQWQEDSLAAVNLSNAAVQGADATDATLVATVMRSNYTQILQKTIKVAETTDAVATYGRAKETAYQLAKASAEVKRDLEGIMLNSGTKAAGSSSVASTFDSYQAQIDAGNLFVTGSSSTAMTEAKLLTALQGLYGLGVDPSILMIPPGEAVNIASYAAASGRYRTIPTGGQDKKLVNVVDLYVSPFGEVKVVLNRWQVNTDHLIFDPSNWRRCVLRSWTREPLAKTGDAHRMQIVGEFSLKHKNFKASAIVRKSA